MFNSIWKNYHFTGDDGKSSKNQFIRQKKKGSAFYISPDGEYNFWSFYAFIGTGDFVAFRFFDEAGEQLVNSTGETILFGVEYWGDSGKIQDRGEMAVLEKDSGEIEFAISGNAVEFKKLFKKNKKLKIKFSTFENCLPNIKLEITMRRANFNKMYEKI